MMTGLKLLGCLYGLAGVPLSAFAGDFSLTITQQGSSVGLEWPAITGRQYSLRTTTDFTGWNVVTSPPLPSIAISTSMQVSVPVSEDVQFFQVVETPSPYDPPWAEVASLRTIHFSHNPGLTDQQNGAGLKSAMQALIPGDSLLIGSGTYNINSLVALDLQGTAAAPIQISAGPGANVHITRPNAGQNLINVGVNSESRYLSFRNIEFSSGSHGIRLYSCSHVWIDNCKIHDTGDVGLSANARDTDHLYITRNEIRNTGGAGEGMYLGGNNASVIMSESIIALNHVHDTITGVTQGDGIEVKQGSWGNLIAGNFVHDCNYPCILVYGTGGQAPNIVENNICYGSNDNTMQVQGECIVRNNLLMAGAGSAFASQPHQGSPTNLSVVHNTFVNTGTAARLSAWDSGSNMEFANNACYSNGGSALTANSSTAGVTFAGNVNFGSVTAGVGGFSAGTGLTDFVNVSWDGSQRDARPTLLSPLRGAADAGHATAVDLDYLPRNAPHTCGAYGP